MYIFWKVSRPIDKNFFKENLTHIYKLCLYPPETWAQKYIIVFETIYMWFFEVKNSWMYCCPVYRTLGFRDYILHISLVCKLVRTSIIVMKCSSWSHVGTMQRFLQKTYSLYVFFFNILSYIIQCPIIPQGTFFHFTFDKIGEEEFHIKTPLLFTSSLNFRYERETSFINDQGELNWQKMVTWAPQ